VIPNRPIQSSSESLSRIFARENFSAIHKPAFRTGLSFYTLKVAVDLFLPIVLAGFLGFLLTPVTRWLRQIGLSSFWASLLGTLGFLTILICIFAALYVSLARFEPDFPRYLDHIQERLMRLGGSAHQGRWVRCYRCQADRSSKFRILVVDDNVDSAQAIGKLLQLKGYEVRCAFDGASAITAAQQFGPHLVLLDISLPDIDGYEVLRRLREQPHASQPLVAAVTGFGQPEDRRHTQEAGFDHHLVKPFGPDALMALIQSLGPK
jgi:CheY-like chemotaxis protein